VAGRYDLVIVGMGSGGMVAAEFAASLGLKVCVVERDRVGGDCLWTGCVPSKALLASAKIAHHMRTADAFGITAVEPLLDTAKVWARVRAVQERIAAIDDDPERFRAEGIEVLIGEPARLTSATTVKVGGRELETRHVLLCTGSRPTVPPIDGLTEAGFLSSETLFELERAPASVITIGGGPIAVELAQALQRLGVEATLLEREQRVLARDEPALVDLLVRELRGEGVDLQVGVEITRAEVADGRKVLHGTVAGEPRRWEAEELVVAAGRTPNVEGLGLDEVGIECNDAGVVVGDDMQTSLKGVYAAGDVAGRHLFTHSAAYEGVRAVRNMFFPASARKDYAVPWCTFTDPELAHAGLTEAEARARHGEDKVEVWREDLEHSDRARADGAEAGAIIVITAKGRIVGANILAPAAGEMIGELALAIHEGIKLADLGSVIHVYPTLSTSIGRLGGEAAFRGAQRYRRLVRSER